MCGWPPDRRQQAARRCTLPVYRGRWTGEYWERDGSREDKVMTRVFWGSAPTPDRDYPSEEPGDGCPSGWTRCGFAESFLKYRRRLVFSDYGGIAGRQENPLIDGDTPRRILALLSYYEQHERAAIHRFHEDKASMER